MPMPLVIEEILGRSDQGVTRPFLCRCEDDRLYYVKGRDAGPRSLLCEWFAGHLARRMGLPVPEFTVVQAEESLLELHPEGRALGPAPAFASLRVEHVQELTISHIEAVDIDLRADVMVFDWWIHNQDRTLTEFGGNPNLLWDASDKRLVVIDHNVAFDRDFDTAGFREGHVFSKEIPLVFQDLAHRALYSRRLREALAVWPEACNNVPNEWWYLDQEQTVPTDFDPASTLALLGRCTTEEFWRLP